MKREVIYSLGENGRLPEYKSKSAAACDLYSSENTVLGAGERKIIHTELCIEIPKDAEAQVRGRSGLTLKGYDVKLGTIDADYRGEVGVIMKNDTSEDFNIVKGDRIAQLAFNGKGGKFQADWFGGKMSSTERDKGGFGSTGKEN